MCYTRGLAVLANAKLNPLPLLYLNEQPSTITSRVQVSCVYLYFVHASVRGRVVVKHCICGLAAEPGALAPVLIWFKTIGV